MPIYTNKFIGKNPWTVVKSLDKKTLIKLRKILKDAKVTFQYRNEFNFLNSVKDNEEMESLYIASYDIRDTNIELYRYQTYLESLIKECNYILSSKYKFKNYRYDILGNWDYGKIIILEKK